MKKMILYSMVMSLLFVFCEREKLLENDSGEKQLKSTEGDTLVIKYGETTNLQDGKSWIKFTDVEDSRCPTNVVCVWEGNAKVQLIYSDGTNEYTFYLHTYGKESMPSETVIGDLYFELSSVTPYSDGSDMTKDDYEIKVYLQYLDKLEGVISEVSGTVRDYTGLDGCGWVIELENGNKLEPAVVLPNIQFYDGQELTLWYKEMEGMSSTCMAGTIAKIYKIESESCPSYITLPLDGALEDYPTDNILMDTAYIQDNTLYVSVSHSGGCTEHTYQLLMFPITCATPPLPKPVFWLSHDAHGDMCEAFIRDTLCFNISALRGYFNEETEIELRTINQNKSITLNY